jgi:cytochrome P450
MFNVARIFQWALIELSKNQSSQTKLREELTAHFRQGSDPTYDQLNNGLPYLDAVVHEILRLHAPVWEVIRVVSGLLSLRQLIHHLCYSSLARGGRHYSSRRPSSNS